MVWHNKLELAELFPNLRRLYLRGPVYLHGISHPSLQELTIFYIDGRMGMLPLHLPQLRKLGIMTDGIHRSIFPRIYKPHLLRSLFTDYFGSRPELSDLRDLNLEQYTSRNYLRRLENLEEDEDCGDWLLKTMPQLDSVQLTIITPSGYGSGNVAAIALDFVVRP
jgi:hypothetical protein